MNLGDHERFAAAAAQKRALVANGLGGYLLLSMAAGAYVGFGIALIFSLAGHSLPPGLPPLSSSWRPRSALR